jgi:phosphoribosylformimino-5-aminoimidazole carboxamide ribotide isomerase
MFEVIPAVDIQRGRAVRLVEGRAEDETVYFDDPLEAAQKWAGLGASWLHLVDLDAAFGHGDNRAVIDRLAQALPCRLEVGGGVRDLATAERLLESVERVILGTAAITQPELLTRSSRAMNRTASPSPSTRGTGWWRCAAGPRQAPSRRATWPGA